MPGKRLKDPSLQRTWFEEVINNEGLILTDWDGLVEARPIPLKLVGNAWFQGSYDNIVYSNLVEDDHNYLRVTTDGGITWRVIELNGDGDSHPPLTLGVPNGLNLDVSLQVLSLSLSSDTEPGVIVPSQYIKLRELKFDYVENIGGAFELYKDYTDVDDDRTHHMRTLAGGTGITLSYVGDTVVITGGDTNTGQANTGANVGTLGVGPYDGMNGTILNFRNFHSAGDILTVTLDDILNNIALEIVEANINHDILENFVPNEHIDHSTVFINTQEGITGGGDLTASRTLTLSFDTLDQITEQPLSTDLFALYRFGDNLHHSVTYQHLLDGVTEVHNTYYVPLTTSVLTQEGIKGGGPLSSDVTVRLAFENLPSATFDPATDYLAIYDTSAGTHAKILISALNPVSISAGLGMNFTTITGVGSVVLGEPSSISETSDNTLTSTSHTHRFNMDSFELIDLGDVDNNPVTNQYLKWNGTTWVTGDPTGLATTPGAPLTSIQFNNNNTFGGNAGLTYNVATNSINLYDAAKLSALIMGNGVASLYHETNTLYLDNVSGSVADMIMLNSARFAIGATAMDAESFLQIQDTDGTTFNNILVIKDNTDADILKLTQTGNFYIPSIDSNVASNMLYFDSVTGKVTYGAIPTTSGGIQTLTADITSGLTVNGTSSSSASVIDLDLNDNRLTSATIALEDYIGFWDVTAEGDYKERKTTLGNFPGWDLYVDNVYQEAIKFGDKVDFKAGSGIDLSYNLTTNELTIVSTLTGDGVGDYPDLLINGVLAKENFPSINLIEGTNISIDYAPEGNVTISADPYFPPYTHVPDAFIAFRNNLYTYDISESTAQRVINAPTANWDTNGSFGEGDYIFTSSGTTLFRYTISTDSTVAVNAADNEIKYIVNGSDGVYVLCTGRCYFVNKTTMVALDYGSTLTNAVVIGAKEVTNSGDGNNYITFFDQSNDRWQYKIISSQYPGTFDEDWSQTPNSSSNIFVQNTAIYNGSAVALDIDNIGYLYEQWSTMIGGDHSKYGYYTYDVPSGHVFSNQSSDAIYTIEVSKQIPSSATPTAYAIVSTNEATGYDADGDRGIYVAKTNNPYSINYGFEQAVSAGVNDLHVEYILTGLFNYTTNVIVGGYRGGNGSINVVGQVHFHSSVEDVKQFTTKDVYEVDYSARHATIVDAPITFVYFDSVYTAGGIPPKEITIETGVDLYVNDVLEEESVYKLNFTEGNGITLSYSDYGEVQIAADASAIDVEVNGIVVDNNVSTIKFRQGTKITITYNEAGEIELNVIAPETPQTEKSVQGDGSSGNKIQLVNDQATPGSNKYYGTDNIGVKGYHDVQASGVDSWIELTDTIPTDFIGRAKNVPMVVDAENALDLVETEELQTILAEFKLLADVPATYSGAPNYYVRVKADGTGLYFSET